ncbi:unnamed protein product, partial [Brachionus calyciflorus]
AEYFVNLKKAKEPLMKEELEKSKIALETSKRTLVNRPMSSGEVVHVDVQIDDIPYNLLYGVTNLLIGMALQMLRNLQKMANIFFKNCLTATINPADVQRQLRSELKSIKISSNFEDNVMKFPAIDIKIKNIEEFELEWLFFDALNPSSELESKYTLNEAIRTEKRYSKNGNSARYKSGYFNGENVNHQAVTRDKGLICFNCKKPGQRIAQCRVKQSNGKFDGKTTKRANLVEECKSSDSDS